MTASPVRVAVNMLWCVPGQVGGSEDYLVRQMLGLAEIQSVIVPTLFVLPGFAAAHPDVASVFRLIEAPIDGHNRARRIRAEHGWLSDQIGDSHLVHHGGGTAPKSPGPPIVLTIHDLQYRAYPQYFSALKRRYLDRAMPKSAARADVIAVPTEFVRSTVIDVYGTDAAKVLVVPHGVERTLGDSATDQATLRERYDLGRGRIVVFPAVTHPHKGHRFLLDVMAKFWTERDLRLVMIGGAGRAEDDVRRAIDELHLGNRALRLGRVPGPDRDGLLRMATAMAFPSEYEGFGAPLIEAMALGVPVICSDRACLPEVAGDAALVLPLEVDAWADALDRVAVSRPQLVAAGLLRAQQFTARRSAEALLEAYGQALG